MGKPKNGYNPSHQTIQFTIKIHLARRFAADFNLINYNNYARFFASATFGQLTGIQALGYKEREADSIL